MMYYLGEILAQTKTSSEQSDGFGYVIAAFIAIWLFIAAYLFWLNRRQESLRHEVEMLRHEQEERGQGAVNQSVEPQELNRSSQKQELEVGVQNPGSRTDIGG